MVASSLADDSSCLGSADSGRVGTVKKDDKSSLPFKVDYNGSENWYKEEHLLLAPIQLGDLVRIRSAGIEEAKSLQGDRLSLSLYHTYNEVTFHFGTSPNLPALKETMADGSTPWRRCSGRRAK